MSRVLAAARRAGPSAVRACPSILPVLLSLLGAAAARAEAQTTSVRASIRQGAPARTLEQRCARCHGADGTGKASHGNLDEIPDFSNHKWQVSRSDTQLFVSVLDGKGRHMPSFRGKLSDAEARTLVAAVRALDAMPAGRAAAREGMDDFERRFGELQEELADLKKQFRDLSESSRKR
jgi:mono/diheme cytochrome c family protein